MTLENPFSNAKVVCADYPIEDYTKETAERGSKAFTMSRSALCEFNHCPSRWLAGYSKKQSDAKDYGAMIDCAMLTPKRFETAYVVAPETYPAPPKHAKVKKGLIAEGDPLPWNRNAAICSAWHDDHAEQQVIMHDDMAAVTQAIHRISSDQELFTFIVDSEKQVYVTADYRDKATGFTVPIKCLLDLVPRPNTAFARSLADFKTAASAAPGKWARDVFTYNYHIQAAMFFDAYTAARPNEYRVEFRHIVQENYAPFEIGKRIISSEFMEAGRLAYVSALKRYCRCLAENKWPGYDADSRDCINGWTITQPESWMIQ